MQQQEYGMRCLVDLPKKKQNNPKKTQEKKKDRKKSHNNHNKIVTIKVRANDEFASNNHE